LLLLADLRIDPNKATNTGATPFFMACQQGHNGVISLLLADSRVDPEKPWNDGATPLYVTCQQGHREIVSMLLADPRVEPNQPANSGATPFFVASENGHKEVISLLLADPRIDPNLPKINQTSPLWQISQNGHLPVIQHLLASERDINTRKRSTFNEKTASEQGRRQPSVPKSTGETEEVFQRRKTYGPVCADLIDEYERDPVTVRNRLRRQPGLREYFAGHLFALVVFHSDNFVAINERTAHSDTKRFFTITSQLPLDLQMVLCNRIFGSSKDIIVSRNSEPGFRLLARTTTFQQ